MAKLYFRYGAMGASKSANALMVRYNYIERGQNVLLLKPKLDNRDGDKTIASRAGLSAPCDYIENIDTYNLKDYACVIVDEAQFLTREQVTRLSDIVDMLDIPIICYGLRADFQGNLFEGSRWLLAWADTIEEIKTVCWCGRKATTNARLWNGKVVKEGAQIMLGGNESYTALCRKHWKTGELAPSEIRAFTGDISALMPMLLDADPSEKMLSRYIHSSKIFAMYVNHQPVSEAAYLEKETEIELMNLATLPDHQRRGYASRLIEAVWEVCRRKGKKCVVGTSEGNVPFYEKNGFTVFGKRKRFFTDNYEPIEENGKILADMILLERLV